jgi:hypothetical protein
MHIGNKIYDIEIIFVTRVTLCEEICAEAMQAYLMEDSSKTK